MKAALTTLSLCILAALPQKAAAWGDDGHMTVALIAQHYLTPAVRTQVTAMLEADTDPLTKHDIASQATAELAELTFRPAQSFRCACGART
jgi:hypothetical protein